MAINATVDGTTYEGITKVTAGGKEISLSYQGSGGGGDLPQQVSEIKYGTMTLTSNVGDTFSITHGCSSAPDIIVFWTDFKTFFSASNKPSNTTIASAAYNAPGGTKYTATVGTTYEGNAEPNTYYCNGLSSTNDGLISNVGSSTFDLLCKSNRRLINGMKLEWLAICLA